MSRLVYCEKCRGKDGASCCSMVYGQCAGRCDLDGHTAESVEAEREALAANHETHIEDGERVSDCPKCEAA